MRVLIAGRNAMVLAKAAGTFVHDLEIHTAGTKAACFALLQRVEFDLIVACETLGDGSGLEVLSHVAVNTPDTLRIFAARPATLSLLKGELGLFGLFRTLPYPINFQKLWAAINLARSTCDEPVPTAPPRVARKNSRTTMPARIVQDVVLEETWDGSDLHAFTDIRVTATSARGRSQHAQQDPTAVLTRKGVDPTPRRPASSQRAATAAAGRQAQPASVQPGFTATAKRGAAVTAQRRGQPAQGQSAQRQPVQGQQRTAATPAHATAMATRGQSHLATRQQEITSGMRAAARYAAAHEGRATSAKPTRIPESDAFKRARARRDAGRVEPIVSSESLSQLAKAALTKRPPPQYWPAPAGKKRAAWYVGSGVFAATTAAVLTFFMVNANNSIKQPKLPRMASITQPVSNKVFPWQPETQQPTRQGAFMRSEAPASTVADIQAEAEAASESADGDPDHPGPPPPYSPPPPSEPPSLESPAQWVDE